MSTAPLPENEALRLERLERLLSLGALDTLPQSAFDDITSLASALCGAPIALVSLVDRDHQWFKSRIGMDATEIDRTHSFCAHAILQPQQPFVVQDAWQDDRFCDNPLVTREPNIRAYAGAPLVTADGFALGTLCVIDPRVRPFSPVQLQALQTLARLVVTLLQHEEARQKEEDRRVHEAQLEHERLVAMATSGLDLKAFISPDYVYLHVNETYLVYWGCTRDEVIGHTVRERLGPELFDGAIRQRLDMALAGQPVFFQHLHQYTGVGPRHMEIAMMPVRNARAEVIGVVLRSHDIQALKEKEAELGETVALLENRTREQQRFIHIMSHDLREPINSINNFASLLEADHLQDLPPMGQRYLGYVRMGGQRMANLLDDLLSYVQLDHQTLKSTRVELHRLALDVLDDLSSARERTRGRVELQALPAVTGDESLLRLALQNLIANGLKFCHPGVPPVVQVSATQTGDFVELSVTDNGIGIPEEHQNSIFEIFQRLHSRKAYEGSGLGLSICRRIAELHGGTLTVRSSAAGGCRFTLHLPTAWPPPPP